MDVVFVINPGSTSTKAAIFSKKGVIKEANIQHDVEELKKFDLVSEQFDLRFKAVEDFFKKNDDTNTMTLVAVMGRGCPLKPLEGGVYAINDKLLEDASSCKYSNHASNLGSMIAHKLGEIYNVPSFIADPVTVDNFWDVSRISGYPTIVRKCRSHALNIKATARRDAESRGKKLEEVNYVVAHIGGGISICSLEKGNIRDVNDGLLGEGPFSPIRAGTLPINGVMDLCYSGKSRKEVEYEFSANSGFQGYLGTADFREVLKMVDEGDEKADLIYRTFVYQIAKEIGRYAAALKGNYDAILITGGIAHSERFTNDLKEYVSFLGEIRVYPGEGEMQALAESAFLAVEGKVEIKEYS